MLLVADARAHTCAHANLSQKWNVTLNNTEKKVSACTLSGVSDSVGGAKMIGNPNSSSSNNIKKTWINKTNSSKSLIHCYYFINWNFDYVVKPRSIELLLLLFTLHFEFKFVTLTNNPDNKYDKWQIRIFIINKSSWSDRQTAHGTRDTMASTVTNKRYWNYARNAHFIDR